jgi:hypothetical protein
VGERDEVARHSFLPILLSALHGHVHPLHNISIL